MENLIGSNTYSGDVTPLTTLVADVAVMQASASQDRDLDLDDLLGILEIGSLQFDLSQLRSDVLLDNEYEKARTAYQELLTEDEIAHSPGASEASLGLHPAVTELKQHIVSGILPPPFVEARLGVWDRMIWNRDKWQ